MRLYQIYKSAGAIVAEAFGVNIMHERQYAPQKVSVFAPDNYCTPSELREAMQRVLADLPSIKIKPKVQVKKVVSIEEMIDRLQKRVEKQLKMKFSELMTDSSERHTVIVGFLAVLESVKQGSILVSQLKHFDDFEIEHAKPGLPRSY